MIYKILTLNTIAPCGLDQLSHEAYEIASEIQHPDAILVRSSPMHDMVFPNTLRVVGRAGTGVNNIPVAKLTQLGIPVLNTPGANANAVKELVLAGMLIASRNLYSAWNYIQSLQGDDQALHEQVEKDKKQFVGTELFGKTLGIVGLGNVGVKVANAAVGLGMNVIGYDPTITVNRAWELSSQVKQAHNIDTLLAQSDFVSLHIPLIDETRHLINSTRLQSAKSGITLLNFSRDGIVDNHALLSALESSKVAAYICDFPTTVFKNHPRAISLPHLGASTKEAEENCAMMITKQIKNFLENGSIINSVNFPDIEMPPSTGVRLTLSNANVPNMVAKISSQLGEAGFNIVDLLNKSRHEIAYTLIDIDKEVTPTLLQKISEIEGVLQVRQLISQK